MQKKLNFSSLLVSEILFFWIFFILLYIMGAFWIINKGIDANYDLWLYHYFNGYMYTHDKNTALYLPTYIQTFLHPFPDIFIYYVVKYFNMPFRALIFYTFQFLSLPPIFLLFRLFITNKKCIYVKIIPYIVTIYCLLSPIWLSELGGAFVECLLTPFLIWGLYFLFKSERLLFNFLCGLFFTLAFFLKLTNSIYFLPFFLLLFILFLTKKLSIKNIILIFIGIFSAVIIALPHYYWVYKNLGNPIFPYYNLIFKSPYYPENNWSFPYWHFKNILDFLNFLVLSFSGTTRTAQFIFADPKILISFITILFFIPFYKRIKYNYLCLAIFYFFSFTLWAYIFAISRYNIPDELISGLIIACSILTIFKHNLYVILSLIILTIIQINFLKIPDWSHTSDNINNLFRSSHYSIL